MASLPLQQMRLLFVSTFCSAMAFMNQSFEHIFVLQYGQSIVTHNCGHRLDDTLGSGSAQRLMNTHLATSRSGLFALTDENMLIYSHQCPNELQIFFRLSIVMVTDLQQPMAFSGIRRHHSLIRLFPLVKLLCTKTGKAI